MNLSAHFIDRPRLATVIAVVMAIAGALALFQIPIAQFPQITPPEVQVTASYPGANASVLEESVGAPIEDQVNGVEDMLYMSSSSTNNGTYSLTVTFAVGTDPALAQVNVQNRVALATPRLPASVTQTGVSVRARSSSMLMGVAIYSPEGTRDEIFISNYAANNIRDAIARVAGVGEAGIFGPSYSMRIWMNPDRMQALGLTATDLTSAIQAQNAQASAGQLGSPPATSGQQLQLTIMAQGRLATEEDFSNIIVRTNTEGALVRLRDVARVELGAQSYDTASTFNGQPSATVVVYQSAEANALAVSRAVLSELDRLSRQFPEDVAYAIVFDTTAFITETIKEIAITLAITFALVVAVTYFFLQDWRATVIPTLTIPVSLIGGFAVLYLLDYSANTITLFAVILAISLVVDDAIIVVENVKRLMAEERLNVHDATRRTMSQVTGPIVATTLVLAALFVPIAFVAELPGSSTSILRDDPDHDYLLDHQCTNAQPGLVCPHAQVTARAAVRNFWDIQPRPRLLAQLVRRDARPHVPAALDCFGNSSGDPWRGLWIVPRASDRIRAERGSGIPFYQCAIAQCRFARADTAGAGYRFEDLATDTRGCEFCRHCRQ